MELPMADYYQQTVVQQTIPDSDMTPIERLLLSNIFTAERDRDGWYFYADENPALMVYVDRKEIEQALAASPDDDSAARAYVTEQFTAAGTGSVEIDLDISGTSYEFFFQDIVKRSKTLKYVGVVAAFTCSRMRPDGFGGMAVLITRDAIVGKSTGDFLEDMIAEAGLDEEAPGMEIEAGTAAAKEE
jgi:hypothetical protein